QISGDANVLNSETGLVGHRIDATMKTAHRAADIATGEQGGDQNENDEARAGTEQRPVEAQPVAQNKEKLSYRVITNSIPSINGLRRGLRTHSACAGAAL